MWLGNIFRGLCKSVTAMLYIIEPVLAPKIQALPFIERYGGIAHPMTHSFGTETLKTFPVSMSLTGAQCFDQGKYANLVPDERYKSVSYLEGLTSPGQITFSDPKSHIATITQSIKLVVWLNMAKLGRTSQADVGLMALAAIAAIQGNYPVNYAGARGRLEVNRATVRMDRSGAFGGYSYTDKQPLFMWPFGFFAVEFNTITQIPKGCLTEIENLSPIDCVTLW
jgi:hypothetical protein